MNLVPCEVFIRGLEFQKLTQNGVLQSVQLVTAKEWIQLRIHHMPYSLARDRGVYGDSPHHDIRNIPLYGDYRTRSLSRYSNIPLAKKI
jgi:hypothetical protein